LAGAAVIDSGRIALILDILSLVRGNDDEKATEAA
jgi:chemotaxis protein histidine kinase CheA